MWRLVAIGLLAANLLFLGWVLMIAPPSNPASRAAPPPAAPRAVTSAAPAPVPTDAPAPRCVSLGPFGDPAVAVTVSQRLESSGLAPTAREERQQHRDGYWIVVAPSLDAAAELMSHNPTMACGLAFEVRPIETQRASAYVVSNETPSAA